jgi:hypothetical protein
VRGNKEEETPRSESSHQWLPIKWQPAPKIGGKHKEDGGKQKRRRNEEMIRNNICTTTSYMDLPPVYAYHQHDGPRSKAK